MIYWDQQKEVTEYKWQYQAENITKECFSWGKSIYLWQTYNQSNFPNLHYVAPHTTPWKTINVSYANIFSLEDFWGVFIITYLELCNGWRNCICRQLIWDCGHVRCAPCCADPLSNKYGLGYKINASKETLINWTLTITVSTQSDMYT